MVQGQTYYLQATNTPYSTGAFTLSLSVFPDFPSSPQFPFVATLDPFGTTNAADGINVPGEIKYYGITFPNSDDVIDVSSIDPEAAAPFYMVFEVYGDVNQPPVAYGGSLDPVVLHFMPNQQYVFKVFRDPNAGGPATGIYQIKITTSIPDSVADSPATAPLIPVASDGSGQQLGSIDFAFDRDRYAFVAPQTGFETVEENVFPGSLLDPYLSIYDENGTLLGADDNT